MDFKFAKALKDAGFPQEGKGHTEPDLDHRIAITTHYATQWIYFPTSKNS